MRREGLAGKMRVRLLVGEEAEKGTIRVTRPDVVVMCRPAGAHSSWSSWVASSSRRANLGKTVN